MKKAVLAIVTAVAVVFGATSPSLAQGKKPDAKATAAAIAKIPEVLAQTKTVCTPTESRYIGEFGHANAAGKKVNFDAVEVSCSEGMGYVLSYDKPGPAYAANNCIIQAQSTGPNGAPNPLACTLAGNAAPYKGLQPYLVKAGSGCVAEQAKILGKTTSASVYEVACAGGTGAMVTVPDDPAAKVNFFSCLAADANGRPCSLTTKEANLEAAKKLAVAKGGEKPCAIKDSRYVLSATTGDYVEFSCQDGSGIMLNIDLKGDGRVIPCVQAGGIAGGCTLTDVKAAQTADNKVYTDAAKKAGFNCDVSKYGVFPVSGGGKEIVELSCGNRPDGAVAIFSGDGKDQVMDCGRSILDGYRCTYTKVEQAYPALTETLKSLGRTSCVVNGLAPIGTTSAGKSYLEVSCSDGNPGFVIEYPKGEAKAESILSCGQASGIGKGCTLPTNKKS